MLATFRYMSSILTSGKYGYGNPVWESPHNSVLAPILILFEVDAASDAHVWLSEGSGSKSRGYEILLGGWKNKRSEIRRGQQGSVQLACLLHDGAGPLKKGERRKFWISIITRTDSVTIVVGKGWDAWKSKLLVAVDASNKRVIPIEAVSVSTGFGSEGHWSLVVSTTPPAKLLSLEQEEEEETEARPTTQEDEDIKENQEPEKNRTQDIRSTLIPNSKVVLKRVRIQNASSHQPSEAVIHVKASREDKMAALSGIAKHLRHK